MRLTEAERKNLSATEFEESIIGVIRKLRVRERVLLDALSLAYKNSTEEGKEILEGVIKQTLSDEDFDREIKGVFLGTITLTNLVVDGKEYAGEGKAYITYS